MATDCITQVTLQGDGFAKPVVARFDLPHASSDGGLVLVKALDTASGLSARMAGCLDDAREPGKVQHETLELLQQRVFGLCAGYADCNDAARLVHDPIHKLMVGAKLFTFLEREQVDYVVAMPSNRRLDKRARRLTPTAGRAGGASSSRPRSSAIRGARPRTIPGSWSPICPSGRRRCTSSTVSGATWRTD